MIHAIILAGGRGTCFWPLSFDPWLKQTLYIVGKNTHLRQTIKRLYGFHPSVTIWIITVKSLAEGICFRLQPLGKNGEKVHFIIEPFRKNTTPAIGLAALILNKISANSIMIVMPSDHSIKGIKQFKEKLQGAIQTAEEGYLPPLGLNPTDLRLPMDTNKLVAP